MIYSDINDTTPTENPLNADENAVIRAVDNLFNTNAGERLFRPTYYSGVIDQLFELLDTYTQTDVFITLASILNRWERRVKIIISRSSATLDPDRNSMRLVLSLQIIGLDRAIQYERVFTR